MANLRSLPLLMAATVLLLWTPSVSATWAFDFLSFLPLVGSFFSSPPSAPTPTEYWRPVLRYTPASNWINDPNGLIYDADNKQWHLFAQYNPNSEDGSSNQSWAHAVSSDLVQWTRLPVSIMYDVPLEIWSGSAVLDHNSSGLCTVQGQPCLVAVWAGHDQNTGRQNINVAASTDPAPFKAPFMRYKGNPVIDIGSSAFRDPAAFWYSTSTGAASKGRVDSEADGYWVVVITHSEVNRMEIWRSDDLLHWKNVSAMHTTDEGNWDCPSLSPMTVRSTGDHYWMMAGSYSGTPGGYWIGQFDGTTFTKLTPQWQLIDYGVDSYAWITYNSAPNDRRVMVAWEMAWQYSGSIPTAPWRGAASFPRELTLHQHKLSNGSTALIVHGLPVVELNAYRAKSFRLPHPVTASPTPGKAPRIVRDMVGFAGGRVYEVEMTINSTCATPPCACQFLIRLDESTQQAMRVGLMIEDAKRPFTHFMNRSHSGVQTIGDPYNAFWAPPLPEVVETMDRAIAIEVRLLVDMSTVEVFFQGGLVAASYQFFPMENVTNEVLELEVLSGEWTISRMEVFTFKAPRDEEEQVREGVYSAA